MAKAKQKISKKNLIILIVSAIILSGTSLIIGIAIGNKSSEIASLAQSEAYRNEIYGLYETSNTNGSKTYLVLRDDGSCRFNNIYSSSSDVAKATDGIRYCQYTINEKNGAGTMTTGFFDVVCPQIGIPASEFDKANDEGVQILQDYTYTNNNMPAYRFYNDAQNQIAYYRVTMSSDNVPQCIEEIREKNVNTFNYNPQVGTNEVAVYAYDTNNEKRVVLKTPSELTFYSGMLYIGSTLYTKSSIKLQEN